MTERKKAPRPKGTGGIFKPKGSRFYWIKYRSGGKAHYEGTKSDRIQDAQKLLTERLGAVGKGQRPTPAIGRLKLADGLNAVVSRQKRDSRKSHEATERRIRLHLLAYFGADVRMSELTGDAVEQYRAHRMEKEHASLATTNREVSILRRAFRLAIKGGSLLSMPNIETPYENNARTGFFEGAQFEAVCEQLPEEYRAPLTFAFITGWRFKSEVLSLTADRVDMDRATVQLEGSMTKSGKPRTFILTTELRKVLEKQLESIEQLKAQGTITPYIFHRPDGSQIRDMRKRWKTACEKAGCKGKLFHDFRRTAVRNLERAGVPRTTAMAMVGHETESIYKRYAIQDETMLREGAAKLDAWATAEAAKPKEKKGEVHPFPKASNG
jgi:integrase